MKCFSRRNGWNEKGRKVKRIVAGMLASTIVLAFGACKKKDPSNGSASPESNPGSQVDIQGTDDTGKTTYVPHPDGVILETDPYYADTEIELAFPIDETKSLDHQLLSYIRYYDANGLLRVFYNDYRKNMYYGGCLCSYNLVQSLALPKTEETE